MKKLFTLLLLPFFIACSSDDKDNEYPSDELSVTKWVAISGDYEYTFMFAKDKCHYYKQWKDQKPFDISLRYIYNKPNITITYISGGEYAKGTVNDKSMTLTIKDEGEFIFSEVPYIPQTASSAK